MSASAVNQIGKLAGLLVMAAILLSCARSVDTQVRGCRDIVERFLTGSAQLATIEGLSTYPRETQYQIYICANQYMHPPLLGFERQFAMGGAETVAFLEEKLERTHWDATVLDILQVLAEMDSTGSYAVSEDSDLMMTLRAKVARMRSPSMRARAHQLLGEIVAD